MEGVEEMGKNIDKDRQNKTVLFDALKNQRKNVDTQPQQKLELLNTLYFVEKK